MPGRRTIKALRSRARRTAALIFAGLLLAGCGSSSSGGGDSGGDPPDSPISGNPALDCTANGYPCSLGEVSPAVLEESDSLADEALERLESGDSTEEVLDWLQTSSSDMVEAEGDERFIIFRLDGGRPVWIFRAGSLAQQIEDASPQTKSPAPPVPLALAALVEASQSFVPAADAVAAKSVSVDSVSPKVVGSSPEKKKALILSPFKHVFKQFDEGPDIEQILASTPGYEGNVVYKENALPTSQEITLDDFKSWNAYDVVHVSSHGNTYCNDTLCSGVINTGVAYSSTEELLELLVTGVNQTKIQGDKVSYLSVAADFFKAAYPEGLQDTLIFFSACRTFGIFNGQANSSLADALQGDSSVYLGWDGVTKSAAAKAAADKFYETLSLDGVEAAAAYDDLGNLTVSEGQYKGKHVISNLIFGSRPSGGDLRIREIVSLRQPDSGQELADDDSITIDGSVGDGLPDRLPFRILVDGVRPDVVDQFTGHLSIDGAEVPTIVLSTGEQIDELSWEIEGSADLGFDAQENQLVALRAWVDLPDEGISENEVSVRLTGRKPLELSFHSQMDFQWTGVGTSSSEVSAEFLLHAGTEPDAYMAEAELLKYESFARTVENSSGCTIDSVLSDGTFSVPRASISGTDIEVVVLPDVAWEKTIITCGTDVTEFNTTEWLGAWKSFHSGVLAGAENEFDPATTGWVIGNWEAGTGDVIGRKTYPRTAPGPESGSSFTENTTIEIRIAPNR